MNPLSTVSFLSPLNTPYVILDGLEKLTGSFLANAQEDPDGLNVGNVGDNGREHIARIEGYNYENVAHLMITTFAYLGNAEFDNNLHVIYSTTPILTTCGIGFAYLECIRKLRSHSHPDHYTDVWILPLSDNQFDVFFTYTQISNKME